MRELRGRVLVVFVLFLIGVVGVPMCSQLARAYAQEREGPRELGEERERPEREEPDREDPDRERHDEEELISDEAYRLMQKAEELEARGKHEDAEELREKAERIEAEARERRGREREGRKRREREGEREPTLDEAHRLFEKARRLEAEGRREAARELLEEAERLEARFRERREDEDRRQPREREVRDRFPEEFRRDPAIVRDEVIRHLEGQLINARMELEALSERLGERHPRIVAQKNTVRRIENEIDRRMGGIRESLDSRMAKRDAQPSREWREKAVREHIQMAKRLKAEGRRDAAEEHLREAKALRRKLTQEQPRERDVRERKLRFQEEAPSPGHILGEIEELRRDINRLREELTAIRELLQVLIEEREEDELEAAERE